MAYCADTDLFLAYGEGNIRKWADVNNNRDEDEIAARIEWAINRADSYINDRLRRKWHDLPFNPVPTTIKETSAQLAGIYLFKFPRGLVDGEDVNAAMTDAKDEVEKTLVNILAGVLKLDVAVTIASHPDTVTN